MMPTFQCKACGKKVEADYVGCHCTHAHNCHEQKPPECCGQPMLEMIGFYMFSITINDTVYLMPYEARIIIFLQGILTSLAGLATVISAKPRKTKDIRKTTESQTKQRNTR